jgi:hypothetical protein
MKKIGFFMVLFWFSLYVFSDELDIAKQFIDNNKLLNDYSIVELNFSILNTKTFLFYKSYNNRQLNQNNTVLSFTDGVIIKVDSEIVIQYLSINKNGLVKANGNVVFYDFSENGYSHLRFNGWLYEKSKRVYGIENPNAFTLQLTNNGNDRIPADPPLPHIFWDFEINHPVKYENSGIIWPPTLLIEYEWREDVKTSIARTGMRDNGICEYLDKLNDYDKRIIINTMFALHGYEFRTIEWRNYFLKFSWYKPNSIIQNSIEILNEYQRKLFEYLSR